MIYVDGFVIPVKTGNKEAYRAIAAKAAPIFIEHGAIRVVECWGDDVPHGTVTDFYGAVKAEQDETIVFSWCEYPSKEVRDAAQPKIMADERMRPEDGLEMPFDMKRLIYSGFQAIVDTRA